MPRTVVALVALAASLFAFESRAGCCNVVKLDPEVPTVSVRVCEPESTPLCDSVIFEGSLSVGQSESVCTVDDTILYQERPAAGGAYGAAVTALCDGGDVEI